MRIAVYTNCVPFLRGGAEYLADALTAKLRDYGHPAVLIRIPFRWEPPEKILESMLACRLMRAPNVDRVIALKFPAYLVPHDDKVLWLLHQFRQAYDLWGTPYQSIPDTLAGRRIREVITSGDTAHLSKVRKIYTNSQVTSGRLKQFNGLESEVLYPPLLESSHLSEGPVEDFIFYPSRISGAKRQVLAVESMKYVRSPVRLVIAGPPDSPAEREAVESAILQHGLEERVELLARFISEEEKAERFRRCLGCLYIPYDEDSYGYVTLESYWCRKPVITCDDSGGTGILVKDGQSGWVAEPKPESIGAAIDRLDADRGAARRMGEAGFELMRQLRIDWDHVIRSLTQ